MVNAILRLEEGEEKQDYDPPTAAEIKEFQAYGLSDWKVELKGWLSPIGFDAEDDYSKEPIAFCVAPWGPVWEVFEFDLQACLDEVAQDLYGTKPDEPPLPEAVQAVLKRMEHEIATFRKRHGL